MRNYLELLDDVLKNGVIKGDRTGTGTQSVFGRQLRFDLQKGFPAVTTKRLFFRGVVEELLWFLRGEDNINSLKEKDVHIWDEWADESGDVGPIYGVQWRRWQTWDSWGERNVHDQIKDVIKSLRDDPDSRRHIVSSWNVDQLYDMALVPCHVMFQFYVAQTCCDSCEGTKEVEHQILQTRTGDVVYKKDCPDCNATGKNKPKLSCHMYQRSADLFLGVPFNIASYALLTHMVAHVLDYDVGELVISFGDVHIYQNHIDQVKLQLSREPYHKPWLSFTRKVSNIDDFKYEDINLEGYECHSTIKAPIAI